MSLTFEQAKNKFKYNRINELSNDEKGLRYLKLRSFSRAEYMQRFIEFSRIGNPGLKGDKLLNFFYDSPNINNNMIDKFINILYEEGRQERKNQEDELVSELYKINVFDWGGLHQNSLEKTIVDNYVKKIRAFDSLCNKIENELHHSMKSYVLCSWYNHWSSILIEDIFRDHESVIPAVGLIKQVDFFINKTPFDLKVTYLPEGYIKDKRKEEKLNPELTMLKQFSRNYKIHFDTIMPDARLLEDIWQKVDDYPTKEAKELIKSLKDFRLKIIEDINKNPESLIRWLYENQGVRRFDASNRLFLILVDCENFFQSWKLKRAKPMLVEKIHNYLDSIVDIPGRDITFEWENKPYSTRSDIILITHHNL